MTDVFGKWDEVFGKRDEVFPGFEEMLGMDTSQLLAKARQISLDGLEHDRQKAHESWKRAWKSWEEAEQTRNTLYVWKLELLERSRALDKREADLRRRERQASNELQKPQKHARKPQPKEGYVYLLHGGGAFKIGKAQDPSKRIRQLEIALPYPVQTVATVPTDDARALESKLHKRFKDKRLNGEWFDLSAQDVAYIKGLAA